jgi:hypothetical protein
LAWGRAIGYKGTFIYNPGPDPADSINQLELPFPPPSRINRPYYELQIMSITCPECGWHGVGADLAVGEIYELGPIIELQCPKCGFDIAFTQGPSIAESRAHWDQLSDAEKEMVEAIEDQS